VQETAQTNNKQSRKKRQKQMTTDINAIDLAIAAAKIRMAAQKSAEVVVEVDDVDTDTDETSVVEAPVKTKRVKLTDEERAAKQEQIKKDREERKAQKAVSTTKIDKAASKLPVLEDDVKVQLDNLVAGLSTAQISVLVSHLQHHVRANSIVSASTSEVELKVGATVKILQGDPRYVDQRLIGAVGTVSESRRIRCFVKVEGQTKPVYLFKTDVELVTE
jgi:hypothetical protein